jgi:hypothetical protein
MNIPSNVLKYYLRNVYFLSGTGCGGKTTMSKAIAEKFDFVHFSKHQVSDIYKKIAHETEQPAMTKKFADWGEYFNRSPGEYSDWLLALNIEELEMMLMDLIILSKDRKVIVDLHVEPKTAMLFTEYNRIAFLLAEPELIVADYFNRGDHQKTYERIMNLPDPVKTFANLNSMLIYSANKTISSVYDSGLFYVVRNKDSTVRNTLMQLEGHFQLSPSDS